MKFKTAYDYSKSAVGKCKKHRTYKVMMRPTADCEPCRKLWAERSAIDDK